MSYTMLTGKELAIAPRPLLLCRIAALDGDTVYLSTAANSGATAITYGGNAYVCKVQEHAVEAITAMSAQGYDIPGSFALNLADGDLMLWNDHHMAHGWKGATLTVTMVLWNAIDNTFSTDAYTWDFTVEYAEMQANGIMRVPAIARNAMSRLKVPNVPRQRRCPWTFPTTAAQRADGLNNPSSACYQCGYSADISGGVGNLDSGSAFTECNFTREACVARGMFSTDSSARATYRFGGDTWIAPETFSGKKYTSGEKIFGYNQPNSPGGTYFPRVFGTQWVEGINLAPASEPNSIRSECVVCMAEHGNANVLKVIINGHEIPQGGGDPLFQWRYVTQGGRQGAINTDAIFDGNGDPHGSMCVIQWVVPTELASGGNPSVRVLVSGPPILRAMAIASATAAGGEIVVTFTTANADCAGNPPYSVNISGNAFVPDGSYQLSNWTFGPPGTIQLLGTSATGTGAGGYVFYYVSAGNVGHTNPVWQLFDLLTSGPWTMADFDVTSWTEAAAYCDVSITYTDLYGASSSHARFKSSFALENSSRQTLAQAVLGLRMNAGLILSRNPVTGKLSCAIERTLADQQPAAVSGSNYATAVSSVIANGTVTNGYLAYKFGPGEIEKGSIKITGRSISDTPNRIAFQFQDSGNEYQQDSISQIEPDAFERSGNQDVSSTLPVLGIESFDQASRRCNVEHAKGHYGNARDDAGGTLYIELTTSMKAAHLAGNVGAICGIDYEQLGL